jgi:glycosyltransferase involved in cell wall biosynthesis
MPAAYAASDMVIVPAIEPPNIARAATEAFAMGRPVVASAVGALPEIVLAPPRVSERERIGWLCAPGDSIDLARAIATAVETNTATHRTIAAAAHRFAHDTFSPAHVAAKTLAIYASLLQSNA